MEKLSPTAPTLSFNEITSVKGTLASCRRRQLCWSNEFWSSIFGETVRVVQHTPHTNMEKSVCRTLLTCGYFILLFLVGGTSFFSICNVCQMRTSCSIWVLLMLLKLLIYSTNYDLIWMPPLTGRVRHWLPDTAALLTRMWRAFSSSRILLANSLTESREERSTRRKWTSGFPVFSLISLSAAVPRDSLRQAKITRAPRRAKSRAMNFPIPNKAEELHFTASQQKRWADIGGGELGGKIKKKKVFCGLWEFFMSLHWRFN